MYFEQLFEKYMEWKLLRHLLKSPEKQHYTKELTRKTKIGAGTINTFLKNLHSDKLLKKEIIGNVHLYKLDNELPIIKQLKILNTLLEFKQNNLIEQLLKIDFTITSIVLYGSHANGEYDTKSDIDLLIISHKKQNIQTKIQNLEKEINKTISILTLTIPQYNKLKKNDKIFYNTLITNHICLYGSELT